MRDTSAPIMECIANFSEGRDLALIEELVQTIASVSGTHVLHHTSDAHHHRTVITFAGAPDAVRESAFRVIERAAQRIDLTNHRGVHPRLGAADVIPFVPIQQMTMQDCVEQARALGQRVGEELGLPVYLYEAAATRPERVNLADVRRGEYEHLCETITTIERRPDYGPAKVGRAGAVIIGARKPLIAFNVYLTTDDVRIARRIARAIRFSSGGLAGVKAIGLLVGGRAQVSMNLTDYKRTPLHVVIEMIRREAAASGTLIAESELIGLIPEDALLSAAAWYLQLHDFEPSRILEKALDDTQ